MKAQTIANEFLATNPAITSYPIIRQTAMSDFASTYSLPLNNYQKHPFF